MINITDFRKKTLEEIKAELEKMKKDYHKVVSDVMQKKEKNVRKMRLTQKDIARMQTVISEKLKVQK